MLQAIFPCPSAAAGGQVAAPDRYDDRRDEAMFDAL